MNFYICTTHLIIKHFLSFALHRNWKSSALVFHQPVQPLSLTGSIIIKSTVIVLKLPSFILCEYPSLQCSKMNPITSYVSMHDHGESASQLGTPCVMQSMSIQKSRYNTNLNTNYDIEICNIRTAVILPQLKF